MRRRRRNKQQIRAPPGALKLQIRRVQLIINPRGFLHIFYVHSSGSSTAATAAAASNHHHPRRVLLVLILVNLLLHFVVHEHVGKVVASQESADTLHLSSLFGDASRGRRRE